MGYETILTEVKGRVGLITLNRPKAQCPEQPAHSELDDAWTEFERDPDIGCIVLTSRRPLLRVPISRRCRYWNTPRCIWTIAQADRIGQRRKPLIAAVADMPWGVL